MGINSNSFDMNVKFFLFWDIQTRFIQLIIQEISKHKITNDQILK